jgi:hypothetical protein
MNSKFLNNNLQFNETYEKLFLDKKEEYKEKLNNTVIRKNERDNFDFDINYYANLLHIHNYYYFEYIIAPFKEYYENGSDYYDIFINVCVYMENNQVDIIGCAKDESDYSFKQEIVYTGTNADKLFEYMAKVKATEEFVDENSDCFKPNDLTEIPQQIDIIKNSTKKTICESFKNMDKKGWEYAFINEKDYNQFTNILTSFFEYGYIVESLPETKIKLKKSCKTKVARVLGEIHKELSNEDILHTDTEYFKIIRILSRFETVKEEDLYKALTR